MASKIQLYKSRANICAAYASDVAFAVSGYPSWRTKAAALVIALFWDTCLFAASQNDNTKEYLTCVSNAEGVTEKMLDCINVEFDRQDSRLNSAYKKLMSKVPKHRKDSLVEAQRAWISFRDANCGFYHDPDGGSAAHVAGNECMLNATIDRASEIENLLSGY
jgi:uncharacterized protein YecT (DUF1311 family)